MKTRCNILYGVVLAFTLVLAAAGEGRLKTLVVTGGHSFEAEPFFKMFSDNAALAVTTARQDKTSEAYDREDLPSYEVVVLYDMVQKITPEQKAKFLALLEKGVGLVVLHHALVSYQDWPEFEKIIGGKYLLKEENGMAKSDYQHDVQIPVQVVAKNHPITAGLKDFSLMDEIYLGFRTLADVLPLITTTHPKSGKPLAWAREHGRSRVVYIQLGHGPQAFSDPNYKTLLAQSIQWASAKGAASGWVQLFDGKSLDGWMQKGGQAKYRVENGEIVGASVPNTGNTFLCTTREYSDFELELEFKTHEKLNSGVQIRSHCFDQPTEVVWKEKTIKIPAGRVHGYQVEIDPSARAWSAGIYDEGRRGWLNDLKQNEAARAAFKPGDWNKFRILCVGDSLKTWINDVPAADLKDDLTKSGFIALQVHGVGKNETPMEVRFRNVRLREIK